MTIFDFFKIRFLSFYKAELKAEDIFVLRRVRAISILLVIFIFLIFNFNQFMHSTGHTIAKG